MIPEFDTCCEFIAKLPEDYPLIDKSTLVIFTIGPYVAEVEGQIFFSEGYVLSVWELLDFQEQRISSYSYAVDRQGERQWWYDTQTHPDDPSLAPTDPHHKHVHPDIRHNRVPAPNISFIEPNLTFLIHEIIQEIKDDSQA